MVYRNGWREFLITAISFGLPMSLLFVIRFGLPLGLAAGALAGVLFSGIMMMLTRGVERSFSRMRSEISTDRAVICDGGATWQGLGGWLFLTEQGLEFYPHKFNHGGQSFSVPTEELVSVSLSRNIVTVALRDGGEVSMVVSHAKAWAKEIQAVIPMHSEEQAP